MNQEKLHPDLSSDILDSHVNDFLAKPAHLQSEALEHLEDLSLHPNLSSSSVSKLYNHVFPLESKKVKHEDIASNLLSHKNASGELANDFLKRADFNHHDEAISSAVNHPNVDKNLAVSAIKSKLLSGTSSYISPPKNTDPLHFEELLKERSTQLNQYKNLYNLDNYVYDGLAETQKHTPESLDRAVTAFSNMPEKYKAVGRERSWHNDVSRFIKKQDNLSSNHLDKLYNIYSKSETDESKDVLSEIVKHPNVDPILIAKVAQSDISGHYWNNKHVYDSISSPRLPEKTRKSILKAKYKDTDTVEALLDNPNITEEEVRFLAEKNPNLTQPLKHEKAPHDLIEKKWQSSDKSTAAAREILDLPNTSPNILKELVNHKNQDVAILATKHKNANEDVINEALSRKAVKVQEAARLHPLVANREIKDGLLTGKLRASAMKNNEVLNVLNSLSEDEKGQVYKSISSRYKGDLSDIKKNTKESIGDIYLTKAKLISSPYISEAEKNIHVKELSEHFAKAFPETNAIDLRRNDDDDGKYELHKSFVHAVLSGNKEAQKTALNHPSLISSKDFLEADRHSPEFLAKANDKLKELKTSAMRLIDRYGQPRAIPVTEALETIAFNKKTSEETFSDIMSNPEIVNDFAKTSLSYFGGGTILDKRYKDYSDEDKKRYYNNALSLGEDGSQLVLASKHAPSEVWEKAFNTLSDESISNFSEHKDITQHTSNPKIWHKLLNLQAGFGEYSKHSHEKEGITKIQGDILRKLDSTNEVHKQIFSDFIENNFNPINSPKAKISSKKILSRINKSILNGDYGDQVIKKIASYNTEAGAHFALAKTELINDPDSKIEYLNNILSHSLSNIDPAEVNDHKEEFWASILNKEKTAYSSSVPAELKSIIKSDEESKPNGKLDFLMDISPIIKKSAIESGLISEEAIQRQALQDPNTLTSSLRGADLYKRKLLASSYIKSINSPESLKAILAGSDSDTFSSYLRVGKNEITAADAERISDYSNAIAKLDPDSIKTLADMLSSGATSKENTKKAINEMISSIENSEVDQSIKSRMMVDIFNTKAAEYLPKKKINDIVKTAVNSKDIDTLININQSRYKTDSSSLALNNALKNPEILPNHTLKRALELIPNRMTTVPVAKSIVSAYEERFKEDPNAIKDLIKSSSEAIKISSKEFEDFYHQVINKYRTSDNTEIAKIANTELAKNLPYATEDKAIEWYLSLPNDISQFHGLSKGDIPISSDLPLINDSRVLETATGGWKLEHLMRNAYNLENDSIKVLTNRIISRQDIANDINPLSFRTFLANAISNDSVDEDSVKKLIRINPEAAREAVIAMGHLGDSNILATNANHVVEHIINNIDDKISNPSKVLHGDTKFSKEHTKSILDDVNAVCHYVGRSHYSDQISNFKNKYSQASEFISKAQSIIDEIVTHHIANNTKQNNPSHFDHDLAIIEDSADRLLRTGLDLDSNNVLSVSNLLKSYVDMRTADGSTQLGRTYTELLGKMISKASNLKTEHWQKITEDHSYAPLFFHYSQKVDKALLDSINYSNMFKHFNSPAETAAVVHNLSEMFKKMDKEALDSHGENLFEALFSKISPDMPNNTLSSFLELTMPYMSNHLGEEKIKQLASKALTEKHKSLLFEHAVQNGIGGSNLINDYYNSLAKSDEDSYYKDRKMAKLLKSPSITEHIANDILNQKTLNTLHLESLLSNPYTPSFAVDKILEKSEEVMDASLLSKMAIHPKISKDSFEKIYNKLGGVSTHESFDPESSFNPALWNPKFGPEKLRQTPVKVNVGGVENNLLPRNASGTSFDNSKKRSRLMDFMSKVPVDGISWAEFKKLHPDADKFQDIKKVFIDKKNQLVFPEDFINAVKTHDDSVKKSDFFLTYSKWSKNLQVHDKNPNLIIQLNPSESMSKEFNENPELWQLAQHLMKITGNISDDGQIGMHPVTPHGIAWVRVDTRSNKGWIIEELQSDFAQKFRGALNTILKNSPSGITLGVKKVAPAELKEYAKKIDKIIEGYMGAQLESVKQAAKAHGVKKIYMHGHGVRAHLSGGARTYVNGQLQFKNYDKNFVHERIRDLYERLPAQQGFTKVDYTDYPNFSNTTLKSIKDKELPTYCWEMKIDN